LIPQYKKGESEPLRRDEAIYAAVMIYHRKTGQVIKGDTKNLESFSDWEQVQESCREAMDFAVTAGIVVGDQKGLSPQREITRLELLVIIERLLLLTGEI
jgi:hypothetical protein